MCSFWRQPPSQDDLPPEQWRSVLGQLRAFGINSICFQGGEPTLYRDIIPLAAEALKMGFVNRQLITNGSIAKTVRSIAPYLTDITLSLDGVNGGVHDEIRGVAGTGDRVRALLVELSGMMPVSWSMVLQKKNIGAVGEALDFAAANNIREMILSFVAGETVGKSAFADAELYGFDINAADRMVGKIYRRTTPVLLPSLYDTRLALRRYRQAFIHRCDDPGNNLIILPDGAVHICCGDLPSIGNCTRKSIEDIWNDPATVSLLRKARAGLPDPCKRCRHVRTYFNVKSIVYNLLFSPGMFFPYYFRNRHVRKKM
jgi:radical SAM protein with 4Fe4S-binding SPASM domain